ncbi:MAG: hypothetical protein LBV65_01230 [Desulfovibrio sp.]|jgi:hypothetical protein|nr:hypothetical protein [Desulfovibrio sp.]
MTIDKPSTAMQPGWPRWTDTARLDDSLSAQAFEATPPACKAAIKTGLALAHMYFGQPAGHSHTERSSAHRGFWQHTDSFPAPWAVVAFTPDYTAAARLAAACAPALLAGVPRICAVCVGGAPSNAALVCLDLSGVEDIFLLDMPKLSALLEECQPSPGRLVLLHNGELDNAPARVLGIPCYEERWQPPLALPDPEAFDLQTLAFAHGRALENALEPVCQSSVAPAALYLKANAAQKHCRTQRPGQFYSMAPLTLAPGCEGFWLHNGLTPDFFRVERLAFGPINEGA